jgi:hypothetical protein
VSKKKRKKRATAQLTPAETWAFAKDRGAIIPDYMPDCPLCDSDEWIDEPLDGTGIYLCGKCGSDIVVILLDKEEFSVMLESLEQYTGQPSMVETWDGTSTGSTKYRPEKLVELKNCG